MKKNIIGIIGLGYVGLPLAVQFSSKYNVIGFDLNEKRIKDLLEFNDSNKDVSSTKLKNSKKLRYTNNSDDLIDCNIFIVTVPTPIDKHNKPNLNFLKKACILISKYISKKNIVIFESTVYPGVTEEFCAPLIEKYSKLIYNKDFYCGYSPERINPNDKLHTIEKIIKITSGSNKTTTEFVDRLYGSVIKAGTFKVSSIRVAEAAKVIENAQRDINIAFVNELSIIFDKLNLNTKEVLNAASTKWNFLKFEPGLVGGHCIGIDPFYLTYKAKLLGYNPKVILSGRKVNDSMSIFVVKKKIKNLKKKFSKITKFRILILGASFKENCNDLRNSKALEIRKNFIKYKCLADIYDPLIDNNKIADEYSYLLKEEPLKKKYHCVIIAVKHKEFKIMGEKKIRQYILKKGILFDLKNIFNFNKDTLYL